jgi:hypothetical protein
MNHDNASQLRRIVDELLLSDNERLVCYGNFIRSVKTRADREKVQFDGAVVLEYWWHLARIGVIALSGEGGGVVKPFQYPTIIVTPRGRALLRRGEESPHSPERYLNAVKRRVGNADPIVLAYLDEAVASWASGQYRSSAVMLGCACEKLIILIADAVAGKPIPPWSDKLKKKLADSRTGISSIFEEVRQALLSLRSKLPSDLADQLDRKLTPIFDHARVLRNQAGHPTGATVSAEDAEAGLLLFPGFYELCVRIIGSLEASAQ